MCSNISSNFRGKDVSIKVINRSWIGIYGAELIGIWAGYCSASLKYVSSLRFQVTSPDRQVSSEAQVRNFQVILIKVLLYLKY